MFVTEGVYRFTGIFGTGVWGANAYLLVGERLTLVDTGFKRRAEGILKQVMNLGYSPYDISNIIITHHHADHIGSLSELKRITQAKVYAHKDDAPYIEGWLPQSGPTRYGWLKWMLTPLQNMWVTMPVGVDVLLDDGDELPIMGGIKVLHTPGHTLGSISLYLKRQRLVIAGDVLIHRFFLGLPSLAFTVDIAREIESIKKLTELDFDIVCFGHGAPLVKHARESVIRLVQKAEKKYQKDR